MRRLTVVALLVVLLAMAGALALWAWRSCRAAGLSRVLCAAVVAS